MSVRMCSLLYVLRHDHLSSLDLSLRRDICSHRSVFSEAPSKISAVQSGLTECIIIHSKFHAARHPQSSFRDPNPYLLPTFSFATYPPRTHTNRTEQFQRVCTWHTVLTIWMTMEVSSVDGQSRGRDIPGDKCILTVEI